MSLNLSGGPIGSALAGLLVTWSLPGTLAIAAVACLLATICAVALIPADEAAL
jgi:hypothetical protein